MSTQVQLRRDTAANVAAFTGKQGECIVDTTNNRLCLQDGTTAGGWPAAKLSEVVTNTRTAIADATYAAQTTDRLIAYTSLTAARIVSLPAASAYPKGVTLTVVDESGNCSATNTITISRAGSDTINGAANAVIAMPRGFLALESNGSNAWTIIDLSTPVAPSPNGASAQFAYIEQLVTCSGPTTNIPLGVTAVIMAVSLRVVTTVTGCASITVNDSQNGNSHWGSGIGVAAGSTNAGVASPGAYYNGSTILALAAVGGGASFTGGTVRMSVLVMLINPPQS